MLNKRVVFEELDKNHADLIIKLRARGLTQKVFFQSLVRAFIDDDPGLMAFFDDLVEKKTKFGKGTLTRINKAVQKGRETKKMYGLTDAEKENIFDILEQENFE